MRQMKAIRIPLEEIKKMEYDAEVISKIKEKIFPDNSGNGMPNKQHWFTKQISKLEKHFYINEETQTYYFTIVEKDYEIRELTLSKDNWNRYNHIFEVLNYDPNNAYFELDKEDEELVLEDLNKHLSECFDNVYENDDNLENEEELVGIFETFYKYKDKDYLDDELFKVREFLGYQDVKGAFGYNIMKYEKALYGFYGICIEEFLEDKNDFDTVEWLEELFTNEEEAIDFAISYIKENY